jgi:hypothetical protein
MSSSPFGAPSPEAEFLTALQQRGATAASSACALGALPRLSRSSLRTLVDGGLVCEGSTGTYYLSRSGALRTHMHGGKGTESTQQAPKGRGLLLALVFWVAVVAVPIVLIRWLR